MCKYIKMNPAVLQQIVHSGHIRGRGKFRERKGGFHLFEMYI